MSLIASLYTGTTGLETNTQDLSIIGDNIANANTIGFKMSRAAFEDQLSQQLLGAGQVGLGARLQMSQRIFTQGSLTSTGIATDLALNGPGLFAVRGTHNGVTSTFYTRDGKFQQDKDGFLSNLEGLRVQGFQADATGTITGQVGDLAIGGQQSNPKATDTLTLKANLRSDAAILDPTTSPFNPLSPSATSNFSTNVAVFDSLGASHQMSIYFRKTAGGAWDWHGLVDGGEVTGGTKGQATEVASGTLSFDSSGALSAFTQTSNFNPTGAVNPQALTFNFGDPTSVTGGTGLAGVKQTASESAVTFAQQNGYSSGQLAGMRIDNSGNITGAFSNGQTRVLGQVAVANFSAPDRLDRAAGNLLTETAHSGSASFGTAGTGGRGSVSGGSLEQSNVDLATEFVRMISAQRGFQANSKTINTADQLLQELIQLKR